MNNTVIRLLISFLSLFFVITLQGCSGKTIFNSSSAIYNEFDSFRFPAINYFHPTMSPNEKWVVYTHIEPVHGTRTLLYSEANKEQKINMPLPKLKKWQSIRNIVSLDKWSPSGKYYAFILDIDCNKGNAGDYIVVVDFSNNQPVIIDFFKIGSDDYYWLKSEKLAYVAYAHGRGHSIVINDYIHKKVSTIHTGISTDNFNISNSGNVIFTKRINKIKKLFMSKLFHEESKPKKIFKELKADNYNLSPNGKYAIVTTSNIVNHQSVVKQTLVNIEKETVVCSLPLTKWPFQWSPDGNKIAYQKKTDIVVNHSGKHIWPNRHFFIFDIISGNETDYGIGISDMFSWCPDGKHIIYSMKCIHPHLGHYQPGIFIMRVDGGEEIGRVSKISSNFRPKVSQHQNYLIWDFLNKKTFFIKPNQLKTEMLSPVQQH